MPEVYTERLSRDAVAIRVNESVLYKALEYVGRTEHVAHAPKTAVLVNTSRFICRAQSAAGAKVRRGHASPWSIVANLRLTFAPLASYLSG